MAGWPVDGKLAGWLAGWLTGWLVGWVAGWLGGARAEGIRVGGGNDRRFGPWGETYGRGEAGNRHSFAAARRTAAIVERNCCYC